MFVQQVGEHIGTHLRNRDLMDIRRIRPRYVLCVADAEGVAERVGGLGWGQGVEVR